MSETPTTLGLIRWLSSITRPVHRPLAASIIFRILTQCLDIALFATAGYGLATVFTRPSNTATVLGLPVFVLITVVILALARAGTHYLEQFTGHYVAFKALELLRGYAFSKLWKKAPGITLYQRGSTLHSGSMLTGLTRDIDRIEVVYAHTIAPLVSAVLVPTLALALTGFTFGNTVIAVPLTCLLLSLFLVPTLGFRRSITATEKTLMHRSQLSTSVSESVHGATEVLTFGIQEKQIHSINHYGSAVLASAMVPARVRAARRACNLLLMLAAVLGVILTGVASALPPVWLTALALGTVRLFETPRGVEGAVGYLDHSISAARRLWQLTHSPEPVTDGKQQLLLDNAPKLTWCNITYTYPGGEVPVLKNFSATAEAGQHTVFCGASGSGKTTAAHLLARFDDPQRGQVLINNTPVSNYTLESLRSQVVLVPQRAQVLAASIAENLRLGAPDAGDAELWEALKLACLAQDIEALPSELNTTIGTGGNNLSGGQLQRLALARALLTRPRVLVLDEFTAHLNRELDQQIRANLQRLNGITVIEISHHPNENSDTNTIIFEKGSQNRP